MNRRHRLLLCAPPSGETRDGGAALARPSMNSRRFMRSPRVEVEQAYETSALELGSV
jgi:hypothetical protein